MKIEFASLTGAMTPVAHRRVLVADDEAAILLAVEAAVRTRFGCPVRTVNDGDAALAALDHESYDVFITDMVMPGVHGLALIQRVRSRWPRMHIIVLTGFTEDFPFVDLVHAGADDFISKPYRTEELAAKLLRIFRERDLREAYARAEAKYRSLFEFSMNGMLLLSPGDFHVMDANQAFCDLAGQNLDALRGMPLCELLAPEDRARIQQGLAIFAQTGHGTLGDVGLPVPQASTRRLDVSVTFITAMDETFVFLACQDVTEKSEVDQQLAAVAHKDSLTGLGNQLAFGSRLEWAVAQARRENKPVCLLAIDLDNFKRCNDTYGHLAGDAVLARAGSIIRRAVRTSGDEGFRCGGDEFAVLLFGVSLETATEVAERIRKQFQQTDNYGASMSVGIAQYAEGMNAIDLRQRADAALYSAKTGGKNAVEVAA